MAPPVELPATLTCLDDLTRGKDALLAQCQYLRAAHDRQPAAVGAPPWRQQPAGFAGLARIVVGQQVSIQSAHAIWARFEAAKLMEPVAYLTADEAAYRAIGLSRTKQATLTRIAQAASSGDLSTEQLVSAPEDDIRAALTAIKGVGPWTADIYLLFSLMRQDAFAPGDLALQIAAGELLPGGERLTPAALLDLAQGWRPWRGVAARMLWAYYGAQRADRVGATKQGATKRGATEQGAGKAGDSTRGATGAAAGEPMSAL